MRAGESDASEDLTAHSCPSARRRTRLRVCAVGPGQQDGDGAWATIQLDDPDSAARPKWINASETCLHLVCKLPVIQAVCTRE